MPFRHVLISIAICLSFWFFLRPVTGLPQLIDRISSEHVILRMPMARESLGRDTIEEIEQCYLFMNKTLGGSLPRRILIVVNWDQSESGCNRRDTSITIGMNNPPKMAALNSLLLHKVGREIARMGLLELSGWAQREDTEFLFEGMIEILVHEFLHSSRSLESAWAHCQILDQMQLLGFNSQRNWSVFSDGKRVHRNAAPGVTFLSTLRELQGRERPIKLFEALKKSSLTASLVNTFRLPVAELEEVWLKKVREHRTIEEITVNGEDAPDLLQFEATPEPDHVRIRLLFFDRDADLLPEGVYVRDVRAKRILQVQALQTKDPLEMFVRMPLDADFAPGQYSFEVTAIDEAGNLRRWVKNYTPNAS